MTTHIEELSALTDMNEWVITLCYYRTREERLDMARRLLRHYPTNAEIHRYWKKETDNGEGK